MKILFVSGRELSYPRNQLLFNILSRSHNVEYIGTRCKSSNVIVKSILTYLLCIPSLLNNKYDIVFIGFWGNLLFFLINKFLDIPIIFDAFVSTFDTVCYDRKWVSARSLLGFVAYWLDKQACDNASVVLTDTDADSKYFSQTFNIPISKFHKFYVGCDDEIFSPQLIQAESKIVFFHGTLMNLHGIEVILNAIKIITQVDQSIVFKFICPRKKFLIELKNNNLEDLNNIVSVDEVPLNELPAHIAQASICLGGHFGKSDKANRTIPGKVFQYLAMGKPVIVGESIANHELLTHDYDAWFCQRDEPNALADAIMALINDTDRLDRLGRNAYKTFNTKAGTNVLSDTIENIINSLN